MNCLAISKDYVDQVADIANVKVEKNKINLYLFYGKECPYCDAEREWLKGIKEDYKKYLNVYEYETWHNDKNKELMETVYKNKEKFPERFSWILTDEERLDAFYLIFLFSGSFKNNYVLLVQ